MLFMIIGSCQLDIHIPESHSLKDKRQVIKHIISLVRNKYNVSISEIGNTELWQRAYLGYVCVADNRAFVSSVLQQVRKFIENQPELRILDEITEIL